MLIHGLFNPLIKVQNFNWIHGCSQARQLIEETIRRNASPVREQSSQDDSSGGSYENSAASSPSQGTPQSPQESISKPPPLQHSLSTSDATTDRDYTYIVQGIKISAPKQQLALAAKVVLEQHFNASSMMQGVTDPNFMRVSQQGTSLLHSLSGHFYNQQRIQDIWSATSSSDEDTYRRDDPRRSSESPDRENDFYQQPTVLFTRDQLLDLASSELTKKAPQDLDDLDPDFAVVIMRQVTISGRFGDQPDRSTNQSICESRLTAEYFPRRVHLTNRSCRTIFTVILQIQV